MGFMQGKRRSLGVTAAAVLVAALVYPALALSKGDAGAHATGVTMRIGFPTANDVQQFAAETFASRVEAKSNGAIQVKTYGAGQLGSNSTMLQNVVNGSLEAMLEPVSFFTGFDPTFTVLDLPGLFGNPNVEASILNSKSAAPLIAQLQAKGLEALAFYQYGSNITITKFNPSSPSAFSGKKIRVIPTEPLMGEMQSLGAAGIPMDVPQIYTSFQQGTIDGVEGAEDFVHTQHYDDIGKYIWMMPGEPIVSFFICNKNWLDGLGASDRQVIQSVATALIPVVNASAVKRASNAMTAMKSKGLTIVNPPKAVRASLKKMWAPILTKFVNSHADARPIYYGIRKAEAAMISANKAKAAKAKVKTSTKKKKTTPKKK